MNKIIAAIGACVMFCASAQAVSVHGPDKNAYQQKTFVLQSDNVSIASGSPSTGGSLKLFDLPEGFIMINGVVIDVLATAGTNYLVTGENLNFAVGSTANANGAWASGETNGGYVAVAFTSEVTRAQAQMSSDWRIDGSETAADLYLNIATTNALATNAAVTVQGRVTVTYSVLGDD